MHDAITIGVPVLAILFGILINRSDTKQTEKRLEETERRLEAKIDALRTEMNAGFERVNDHLIQFHAITGKLDGRLDALERQQR